MRLILPTLLFLVILILHILVFMPANANCAELFVDDAQWQSPPVDPTAVAPPHCPPSHRCPVLCPPQPGTHLHGQPFAYGYFGAHPQAAGVYHRNFRDDWFQWSFYRAD
jgi:hypothetical protein